MRITTNVVFGAFREQIDRSHAWLKATLTDTCGYRAAVLVDRLAQRLVEVGLPAYNMAVYARRDQAGGCFPPAEARINCRRAMLHVGTGRVEVSPTQLLVNYADFLFHWAYCWSALVAVTPAGADAPPSVLVHDLAEENIFTDARDERFIEYCRRGPIAPLRTGRRFLVETLRTSTSSEPNAFTYCRRPLLALLREARLGFAGRTRLILEHLLLLVRYHAVVLQTPALSLLGRDLAYSRIAFALDRRGLVDSVIVTCSSWGVQPLWLRSLERAKVHMIWYSQNPQSVAYDSDGAKEHAPQMRWIKVDTHWVWTRAFARFLRATGHGDGPIEAVGPLIWHLPATAPPDRGATQLLVFDVPAITDTVMRELVGEQSNYFNSRNLRAFLSDIVSLKAPLESGFKQPVSVSVKMKRGMRRDYAQEYFDHVENLSAQGLMSRAGSDDNLYPLVSRSDLVIAYPFTSPAYLAAWLGVPCIYYDPTASVAREDFFDSESAVRFARGPQELREKAIELLTTARTAHAPGAMR